MSREQMSIPELLLSLDGSDLQEAELVKAAVNQQLHSDKGGAVLHSLVEFYLDSSSHQAMLLLSSTRERHHKPLLEKLNECLGRPGSRVGTLTLLGHLVRKQPPWVHLVSRSPLLASLLRCLKADSDVVVLITGVLVLITLLPMIPQAGKQHIYDFFDVFGRLASWSYKNPGQVPAVQLVHLQVAVYSLFHRLYGMFPCNFMSYLRLHYSMKENLDTFQEVVKPMLHHVRVHPELVSGTQDYELDPSRWRCFEVHDIVLECSRVSLDPLDSSCEDDMFSSPLPHLHLLCSPPHNNESPSPAHKQADVRWSPSTHCGLSTPPPDTSSPAPSLTKTTSLSDVKMEEAPPPHQPLPLTSTPSHLASSSGSALTFAPAHLFPHRPVEEGGPVHAGCGPAPSYEQLLELMLPGAPTLFIGAETKEALERSADQREAPQSQEEAHAAISPLKVLDQMIVHGNDAHQHLNRRSSAGSRSGDRSHSGVSAPQGEELQSLRSQLLLVHSQLQYERFKRQQHAIRNRRLLRRVISATALEEQSVAMREQLAVQEEELHCLKESLQEEQRRFTELQLDSSTQTHTLHTHTQQLLLQLQEEQRESQRLQSELQECQSRMRDLEAELQQASNKAYNAEHQLTQLSIKLSSSEQQQQQIFLMNQQLVILRETNRALSRQLDAARTNSWKEASMLQCSVGREFQQLKESEEQHRQKLEAANQRTADLEAQLSKKDQLIQDQKKLLEDTKAQSRCELSSSESRCVSLRRLCEALQSEMLQLYSQTHLDQHAHTHTHTHSHPQDVSRPNGGHKPRPLSPGAVVNGGVEMLSSSPIAHSPLESPLAAGSFLEQHVRQVFGPPNQNQEEAEPQHKAEEDEDGEGGGGEGVLTESPPISQEVEEIMVHQGSPPVDRHGEAGRPTTPPSTEVTPTARQRRHELSIMDYNEMLPEV